MFILCYRYTGIFYFPLKSISLKLIHRTSNSDVIDYYLVNDVRFILHRPYLTVSTVSVMS